MTTQQQGRLPTIANMQGIYISTILIIKLIIILIIFIFNNF